LNSVTSRSVAIVVAALALTGISVALPMPAIAAPNPPAALCPPSAASAGVLYHDQSLYPAEAMWTGSIVSGSFPGVSIHNTGWSSEYEGAPTAIGPNTFTVQLRDDVNGTSSTVQCQVTVAADVRLDPTISVSRLDAPDRYAESVAISKRVAPATAPLIYIASGEGFSDALSGASVAAQRGAPLLLSTSTGVTPVVAEEVKRLRPATIVVLGGETTLHLGVVTQLLSLVPDVVVTRIGGKDRYEVSRNLITNTTFGAAGSESIYLASGRVYPDALSASPAAAKVKAPVMLIDGQASSLTSSEKSIFEQHGALRITILGGTDTVSTAMEASAASVRPWTNRIAGTDRYTVSSTIANSEFVLKPPTTAPTVYLATGADYPDALSGATLAAMDHAPIILVKKDCIPVDAAHRMNQLGVKNVVLLGGPNSLGAGVAALTVCTP
jgi:putative cell wall-binding protein